MTATERTWRPAWPCPAGQILVVARRGAGDPTYRVEGGSHWRALRTPEGPVRLEVRPRPGLGEVEARAWGPGATWVLDALPAMLGALDDPTGFVPRHPVLVEAHRRHQHLRIGRTGLVFEALLPAVLEQKVTGQEAFAGFRRLVRRHGEVAPAGEGPDLLLQPEPAVVAAVPSWEWLELHVDPARSRPVVVAAGRAAALERIADDDPEAADRKLRSLPGVGVWTSAEVRARALGDADAVSFGDYHVAKDIGWALTGAPVDDAGLAVLLEEWRPHRGRVQALVALAGLGKPRRGPRMAPRRHLPGRDVDRP
ncbi:DNA-3-methyladenine glycosylase family protein [Nocardioides jiangxiensis]|uniref:DNA-3-methyladenine glycosylase 2 family protein n=1 Tax=Nocardioides jiangxiensis TaxID=3064524 RepID=A0ABT9B5I1_9ACTN|nr:DNA-3-methyladenine glycosylase 2 family protein [Nocardioides sp. WY-20]MDO7869503.1 DNA-3-methyladenine glycosylase 2 family protein [Nocardioides sp. WY-20]